MTNPKEDFVNAPDEMKKHLETRDRILAAAGGPQTRATIEEIRDVLHMSDEVIREITPSLVRHLAQRVIDLEQTVAILEPDARTFGLVARATELGAVTLYKRGRFASNPGEHRAAVIVDKMNDNAGESFTAHASSLVDALEQATTKARAVVAYEHQIFAEMLRLLAPDLPVVPYVVDAPVVLTARAKKMIADAETEISRTEASGVGTESESHE